MLLPRVTLLCRALGRQSFHTTPALFAGERWRISQGQARSGTEYGPLTDLPDWSYVDPSKGTPQMTKAQAKRSRDQLRNKERIEQLLEDLSIAVDSSSSKK